LHYPQQCESHNLPATTRDLPYNYSQISLPQPSMHASPMSTNTSQQKSNPTVRLQKVPQSSGYTLQSNLDQHIPAQQPEYLRGDSNRDFSSAQYLDPAPQKIKGSHRRISSGSSNNSNDSFSPHPRQFESLPTPLGTPDSSTFQSPGYQKPLGGSQDNIKYLSAAMRRLQSATADDDTASLAFSGPPSVSSMSHDSPATPHTSYEPESEIQGCGRGGNIDLEGDGWMNDCYPLASSGGYSQPASFTQQNIFNDQSYQIPTSQSFAPQPQPNMSHHVSQVSPYQATNAFALRLQAANSGHTTQRANSPVTSVARERSPFNRYNRLQEIDNDAPPRTPMSAMAQAVMASSQAGSAPASVSPKELMLHEPESDDENGLVASLFPDQFRSSSSMANPGLTQSIRGLSDQQDVFGQGLRSFATVPPQLPQQYPFVNHRRRPQGGSMSAGFGSDQTVPEFHAPLISMETTLEEAPTLEPLITSSQQSSFAPRHSQSPSTPQQGARPDDTSSDCGTYTCTYHGCCQRFETPAKLQTHKRKVHRHCSPTTPSNPSPISIHSPLSTTSPVSNRDSQAGPHKCDRNNPSTGKPCRSIFSRPYDLTRHEDTIHNARKQKVSCALCEDPVKTFSRSDALTRHMRVVHPDVRVDSVGASGKGRKTGSGK
jgi:hypothetical protein